MVNADGTITILTDASDPMGEASFSYEVTGSGFITDVGFVTGQIVLTFTMFTAVIRMILQAGQRPASAEPPGTSASS